MIKKYLKPLIAIVIIFTAIMMVSPNQASARSFGGGHSFHSSPHLGGGTHIGGGGGHSFHTPHVKAPSLGGGKSFHRNTPKYTAPKSNGGKSFHTPKTTPRFNRPSTNYNNSHQKQGLFSGFGRSIVHGAGWSIGSNMGNSLWHTMFGFGGNQYIGPNGQTQYQQGGHSGWIMLIVIAIIIFVVYRIYRNRKNH